MKNSEGYLIYTHYIRILLLKIFRALQQAPWPHAGMEMASRSNDAYGIMLGQPGDQNYIVNSLSGNLHFFQPWFQPSDTVFTKEGITNILHTHMYTSEWMQRLWQSSKSKWSCQKCRHVFWQTSVAMECSFSSAIEEYFTLLGKSLNSCSFACSLDCDEKSGSFSYFLFPT